MDYIEILQDHNGLNWDSARLKWIILRQCKTTMDYTKCKMTVDYIEIMQAGILEITQADNGLYWDFTRPQLIILR